MRICLLNSNIKFTRYSDDELTKFIAEKLFRNYTVGWFQGRMEFGPRALGNRSILGNPASNEIKDILNTKIKKREPFRPFAPIVREENANDYFEMHGTSPFMLLAPKVREEKKKIIPAVTHADGTARVQTINKETNPLMWKLLGDFEKLSGVPVLINTSFNSLEPIVCSPEEAIICYKRTKMDYLVLGNFVAERDKNL